MVYRVIWNRVQLFGDNNTQVRVASWNKQTMVKVWEIHRQERLERDYREINSSVLFHKYRSEG